MKITVLGTGYVGLVSGVCFAAIGHDVTCVDIDDSKISLLQGGEIPIYEPGLSELLAKINKSSINFTSNLSLALHECEVIFLAVGTPEGEDGVADLSFIFEAAKQIARSSTSYKLVVTKSTVPPGTNFKIRDLIRRENSNIEFDIASNPEFLREGCAISDFMEADRVVIGTENKRAEDVLKSIYTPILNGGRFGSGKAKFLATDIITAELIKYASNSFLAAKICFINEMADLCEIVGGNVNELSYAIGLDKRIGDKFLNPGPGFGGSCFPKDINAIVNFAKSNNCHLSIIESTLKSNDHRIKKMARRVLSKLDSLGGKKITFLGLAFKGGTDDVRCSPSIQIITVLLQLDNTIKIMASDVCAIEGAKIALRDLPVKFEADMYLACADADLIIIATEWEDYGKIDLLKLRESTKASTILDLRNVLNAKEVRSAGFVYKCIGIT